MQGMCNKVQCVIGWSGVVGAIGVRDYHNDYLVVGLQYTE